MVWPTNCQAYEELSLPAISSRISFLLMRSGPMASNVDSYKLNSSDRNRVFPRTISLTTKILQGKICRPFFLEQNKYRGTCFPTCNATFYFKCVHFELSNAVRAFPITRTRLDDSSAMTSLSHMIDMRGYCARLDILCPTEYL